MSAATEMIIPTEYPACQNCLSRRAEIAGLIAGLDNLAAEAEIETKTTCLPQLRHKAQMRIVAQIFIPGEKGIRRKKPDQTKSLRVVVDCPGEADGVNVQ